MLQSYFAEREIEAYITSANFVVVRMPDIQATLHQLEQRGVYVRDRSSYPGLEGCLRMTVGTRAQTERLLERIGDIF
jgi:histidinol-phosphate aminotransferase